MPLGWCHILGRLGKKVVVDTRECRKDLIQLVLQAGEKCLPPIVLSEERYVASPQLFGVRVTKGDNVGRVYVPMLFRKLT